MPQPSAFADSIVDFQGIPACRIALPDGSQAHISLQGAQVLSWNPGGKGERIYLSPLASTAPGQALRGGVPVIFPQFAEQGPLPRHGFARTTTWQLEDLRQDLKEGYAAAVFSLVDDEASRALWPHAFRLELSVGISPNRLDMELEVQNTGEDAFEFTAALHSYLNVKEVEESYLTGFGGLAYTDQLTGQQKLEMARERVVEDEIDRIYHQVKLPLLLSEPHRSLAIHMEGFPEVVLWNPWEHKCASLADMPAKGFRNMLCIEAAAVTQPIPLAPGADWWGRQTLVCV